MEKIEVILKQDLANLGKSGELVSVRRGYGRNYLIPHGLAVAASNKNKAAIEAERAAITKRALKERQDAEAIGQKIEGVTLQFARKSGEGDKLFGSVTAKDIEEGLASHHIKVDRKKIHLPEPIKAIGHYTVEVRLGSSINGNVKVVVVAE